MFDTEFKQYACWLVQGHTANTFLDSFCRPSSKVVEAEKNHDLNTKYNYKALSEMECLQSVSEMECLQSAEVSRNPIVVSV